MPITLGMRRLLPDSQSVASRSVPPGLGTVLAGEAALTAPGTFAQFHGVDARERRVFWLILVAWIANIFDLFFTLIVHEHRLLTELNPLAALVIPYGTAAIVLYKMTMLSIGTSIFWQFRRHPLTERCAWGYAAVCLALSIWWHALYSDLAPVWVTLTGPYAVPAA
jgi:hypothetical protein